MSSSKSDNAVLAIEGNSGVGKTTTAAAVAQHLAMPWFPEPGRYINATHGERLPDFPGRSAYEVVEASVVWLAAERRRCREMAVRPAPVQVIDCTAVSILAFELAKARFGFPNAVRPLAAGYLACLEAGELVEPTHWLFLTAHSDVILCRIQERGGSRRFLRRADTIAYLDAVRRRFADDFLASVQVQWLDNVGRSVDDAVVAAAALVTRTASVPGGPVSKFMRRVATDDSYVAELLAVDKPARG